MRPKQAFEAGLMVDPFHPGMKAGQEEAIRLHLKDIVEGALLTYLPKYCQ